MSSTRIFLCSEAVDMRKGFEGLCGIIEKHFKEDVFSGALFVFLGRRRDKIKVLYRDRDGLAIWHKRLEQGSFARLSDKTSLDRREFLMMLEGIEFQKYRKRYKAA